MRICSARAEQRKGRHFTADIAGDYELLPQPVQKPYPPLYLAGATDRSIGAAGKNGFGVMLSTLTPFDTLAKQVTHYRTNLPRRAPRRAPTRASERSTSRAGFTSPRPTRRRRRTAPTGCYDI